MKIRLKSRLLLWKTGTLLTSVRKMSQNNTNKDKDAEILSTDCHSLHKQLLLPAAEKDPMVLEKAPRQRRELQAANVESCQGKYLLLLLLNSDGPTRFGAGHRQHVNPRG